LLGIPGSVVTFAGPVTPEAIAAAADDIVPKVPSNDADEED
jgi:hypothetical protein